MDDEEGFFNDGDTNAFFDMDEEEREEAEDDLYTDYSVEEALEDDGISPEEAAFMHGIIDAL